MTFSMTNPLNRKGNVPQSHPWISMTRPGFLFLELVLERLTVLWSDLFFNMWLLMEPSKKTHHKANLKKLLVTSFREPRLCIITILHGTPGDLLCILGVLCSTWTVVNSGTSGRDFLVPMGRTEYESVRCGNLMVARQGFGKHPPKVFNHCFVFWNLAPTKWQLSFYAQGDSPLAPAHCYASSPSFRATGFFSDELSWPVSVDATITGTQ